MRIKCIRPGKKGSGILDENKKKKTVGSCNCAVYDEVRVILKPRQLNLNIMCSTYLLSRYTPRIKNYDYIIRPVLMYGAINWSSKTLAVPQCISRLFTDVGFDNLSNDIGTSIKRRIADTLCLLLLMKGGVGGVVGGVVTVICFWFRKKQTLPAVQKRRI